MIIDQHQNLKPNSNPSFVIVSICFFMIPISCCTRAETIYARDIELPSIRLSYANLLTILNQTRSLVKTTSANNEDWKEKIILREGNLEFSLTDHKLLSNEADLPNKIDRFDYQGFATGDSSVSAIDLNFNDFSRRIRVQGKSPEQVEALFQLLNNDFLIVSSSMGGSYFRQLCALIIFMTALFMFLVFGAMRFESKNQAFNLPIAVSILMFAALFLFPSQDIFAGFAATKGDPSIVVLYGPQISLIGLAASIAFGVLPLVLAYLKQNLGKGPLKSDQNNIPPP